MRARIEQSIQSLLGWVESHDYKGYEPSDGNLSILHPLTFNNPLLERILQQVIWKSPVDIRRVVRVPTHRSTKGMGYMAWGHLFMHKHTGDTHYRKKAEECFTWLMENSSPHYPQFCWGDSFHFSSRSGRRPAFEPTIVWSSLIGQAFLDAYEAFGSKEYLDVVSSICDWIKELPRNESDAGLCLGYTAQGLSTIHNSNMLGAALLARHGKMSGDTVALELARLAMSYSCADQTPDGAWYYGVGKKWAWIDNFHTGYNLDSLKCYGEQSGDASFEDNLKRGFSYFVEHFFEPDGCPKYYHNSTQPIDIQSASQAVETLTVFSGDYPDAIDLAKRVAQWTIENMQAPDGHFYYRDLGWRKVKTPMFHWGQATMFKALALLASSELVE